MENSIEGLEVNKVQDITKSLGELDFSGYMLSTSRDCNIRTIFDNKSSNVVSQVVSIPLGKKLIISAYNLGLDYKRPFFLEPNYTLVMPETYQEFEDKCLGFIRLLGGLSNEATKAIVNNLPKSLGFVGNIILWVNDLILKAKGVEEKIVKAVLKFIWNTIVITSNILNYSVFGILAAVYDIFISSRWGDFIFACFNTTKYKSKYSITAQIILRYTGINDDCGCANICDKIGTYDVLEDNTPIIAGTSPLINFQLDYNCNQAVITYAGDYRFYINKPEGLGEVYVVSLLVPNDYDLGTNVIANKRIGGRPLINIPT